MAPPNMPRADVICPAPERCTWQEVNGIWIVTDSTCTGTCDCTNPKTPAGHIEMIAITDPRIATVPLSARVRGWGRTPGVKNVDFLLAAQDVQTDSRVTDPAIKSQSIPMPGVPYIKPCMS